MELNASVQSKALSMSPLGLIGVVPAEWVFHECFYIGGRGTVGLKDIHSMINLIDCMNNAWTAFKCDFRLKTPNWG